MQHLREHKNQTNTEMNQGRGRDSKKITEMLKQKKTNSWTPVGLTRARASGTNRLTLKSLGWNRHRVLGPTSRRANKERSKVINNDWVNYHACSLSYYIFVETNLYISKNVFTKLSTKIIASIYFFLNLYTKSP